MPTAMSSACKIMMRERCAALLGGLLFPSVTAVVFLSWLCSSLCTAAFCAGLVGFCCMFGEANVTAYPVIQTAGS